MEKRTHFVSSFIEILSSLNSMMLTTPSYVIYYQLYDRSSEQFINLIYCKMYNQER